MALARSLHSNAVRTVRGSSARWGLGEVPLGPAGLGKAFAVGPGPNGDSRKRAGSSARTAIRRAHSCRDARRQRRAVGDGGGGKMLLPRGRHRRNMGRSQGARLRGDAAAGGRERTERHALLAGAPRRHCEFERGADALAHRVGAVAVEFARPASIWSAGMGCGAVSRPRGSARTMDGFA